MLCRLNVFSVLLGAVVIVGVEGASNILLKPVIAATFKLEETGYTGDALSDLNYATDILEQQINSPVPITVKATFNPDDPKKAGGFDINATNYKLFKEGAIPNTLPNTYYPAALADALADQTYYPSDPDITLNLNSQVNWYYGIDPTQRPKGETDFISTVQHEIAHGLGIFGSASYKNGIGSLGSSDDDLPLIYDRFVVDGLNQPITSFPNKSEALGDQLVSDNLFFNGPNAIAANGGNEPKLYAPTTWKDGSSYSHLDQATYDTPGNPNADLIPADPSNAESERKLGPITYQTQSHFPGKSYSAFCLSVFS